MPSCSGTEFGVIDQYLSLRDQIDSEDDSSYSIASDKKLSQLPTSFLDTQDHPELPYSTMAFSAMEAAESLWPTNFLGLSGHDLQTKASPHSGSYSSLHTTHYVTTGYSGCTVLEASNPVDGVPFPEEPDSDIYDLDCEKHTTSFYEKEGFTVKTENTGGGEQGYDELKPSPLSCGGGAVDGQGKQLEDSFMLRADCDDISSYMIMSLREDIVKDCKELSISANPENWTAGDTVKWVSSTLTKSQHPTGPVTSCPDPNALRVFSVPGDVLCRLTPEEFQYRSPYGEFLHQRLEIWRMAMDIISDSDTPPSFPPQQPQHYHPHHHHHNPHHHPSPFHPSHNHHHQQHPATSTTTTTTNTIQGHGAPRISDYGAGTANHHHHHHMPPSISPAPSNDSLCSSSSSSSSSLSSLGGRGGAVPPPPSSARYGLCHDRYEDDVFVAARRKPTPPAGAAHPTPAHLPTPPRPRAGKQTIHLWQFLRELLDNTDSYHDCIKWTDRARGIFKIEDSSKVARLWGRRKNRPAMNYDKLSRSVRQYYKKGIIRKTEHSKRLVYQFCPPYL